MCCLPPSVLQSSSLSPLRPDGQYERSRSGPCSALSPVLALKLERTGLSRLHSVFIGCDFNLPSLVPLPPNSILGMEPRSVVSLSYKSSLYGWFPTCRMIRNYSRERRDNKSPMPCTIDSVLSTVLSKNWEADSIVAFLCCERKPVALSSLV